MEELMAHKRVSIYLVLFCWGLAVAMMHPGFAMMVTGTLLLFMLFVLRFIAHFEGQYMLKEAEAKHGAHSRAVVYRHLLFEFVVYRHLLFELFVAFGLLFVFGMGLVMVVRHVPWLWFPSS